MNSGPQLAFRGLTRRRTGLVLDHELIVDLFAGGGGASEGIAEATGRAPDIAVNHDPAAIETHQVNHPATKHYCASVYEVDPREATNGRAVGLLWLSPDCKHHSKARGGKPRDKGIRSLAWVGVQWAAKVQPRIIALENVDEFRSWGPLDDEGQPIKERSGETFRRFVTRLEDLGYTVRWRTLNAAEYGAPTSRVRFFLVARRDGVTPRWPRKTHGPSRAHPFRTAAECIDWSIPCPSIFERKRPLAEATQRRIAAGLVRYVLEAPEPYIVPLRGTSPAHRSTHATGKPLSTVSAGGNQHALVAPYLVETRNGERKGQRPRTFDPQAPWRTVTATGSQGAVVAAWLRTMTHGQRDHAVDEPMRTITAAHRGERAVVGAWLAKHYGGVVGQGLRKPLGTVTTRDHHALVAAFLLKYYGQGSQHQRLAEPLHTIVSKARFGLVTVSIAGEEYVVVDIGMRMLKPHELLAAQFGPERAATYYTTGTKTEQIARIGNSVPPDVVRALLLAQLDEQYADVEAAA